VVSVSQVRRVCSARRSGPGQIGPTVLRFPWSAVEPYKHHHGGVRRKPRNHGLASQDRETRTP
jgi:hypothetical protein